MGLSIMVRNVIQIAWVLTALVSCGGGEISGGNRRLNPGPTPTDNPKPCDEVAKKVVMAMFADRGCQPCIQELPLLNQKIKELENQSCRVKTIVYMTDDELKQEEADEWGKKLGLPFAMALDPKCRKEYKKYWSGCVMPAGVIRTESGELIKKYKVGAANLNLDDIMSVIRNELGL